MIGRIKWDIASDSKKTYIKTVTIEDIGKPWATRIQKLFQNLEVAANTPLAEYEAWLHIQDSVNLFYASPYGRKYVSTSPKPEHFITALPDNMSFAQEKLIMDPDENTEEKKTLFLPILHISTINLLKEDPSFKGIPRYAAIMDSSIWNFYFNFEDFYVNKKDIRPWIVESIAENTQRGIYDLSIAREFADFNARLTKQSFISDSNGHGQFVSPYVFHSERYMKEQFEMEKVQKHMEAIRQYCWRILLVDDKYKEPLSSANKGTETNKRDIVVHLLKNIGLNIEEDCDYDSKKPSIQLECAANINEAKSLMGKSKYDIILMDYLLNNEYGYQLLSQIKDDKEFAGPQGKNFFIFISAFTTAVHERLLAKGLSRSSNYWYIGEGACPTNTPELLKYRLSELMFKRLEDSGINSLSESHILKITSHIFKEKPEDVSIGRIKAVRERAFDTYHEFLDLHHKYALLKKDKGQSRLVDSFLENKVHMGAMLEHLLQLIHLTAFGTIRQWPEIWEEYKFFTRTFAHKNELASEVTELSRNIEQYIITLKSA